MICKRKRVYLKNFTTILKLTRITLTAGKMNPARASGDHVSRTNSRSVESASDEAWASPTVNRRTHCRDITLLLLRPVQNFRKIYLPVLSWVCSVRKLSFKCTETHDVLHGTPDEGGHIPSNMKLNVLTYLLLKYFCGTMSQRLLFESFSTFLLILPSGTASSHKDSSTPVAVSSIVDSWDGNTLFSWVPKNTLLAKCLHMEQGRTIPGSHTTLV